VVGFVTEFYGSGGYIETGPWHAISSRVYPNEPRNRPVVGVTVEFPGQKRHHSDGHVETKPGGRQLADFHLRWTTKGWLVAQWEVVDK
jgi:hypothetical protein